MPRYLNSLLLIPIFMIITSCDSSDKVDVDKKSMSETSEISNAVDSSIIIYSDEKMNDLLDKSLNYGDCDSFHNAIINSTFSGKTTALFYETQIMAYKYNCSIAYYFLGMDMYSDPDLVKYKYDFVSDSDKLNDISSPPVWNEDNMIKSMAIYYFLKAYELGEKDAYYELIKYFGEDHKKFPKSSDFIKGKK